MFSIHAKKQRNGNASFTENATADEKPDHSEANGSQDEKGVALRILLRRLVAILP